MKNFDSLFKVQEIFSKDLYQTVIPYLMLHMMTQMTTLAKDASIKKLDKEKLGTLGYTKEVKEIKK